VYPHVLDNRLKGGGMVVSLTHRPLFTSINIFWYLFFLETESLQRRNTAGKFR
jgi:hypothetical protein